MHPTLRLSRLVRGCARLLGVVGGSPLSPCSLLGMVALVSHACPPAVPFLSKYVESGFEAVWFASAFKGTTGPAQAWTPLSYHLKNHLSWLKVMQTVPRLAPLRLQGVVLTGWQR